MKRAAHVAAVAVAAVLVLAAAACSAADDGGGVATLGGEGAKAGANPSPSVDPEQALVDFAECMHEHGVEVETSFEEGGIAIEARPGEIAPGDLEEADAECRHLLPRGQEGEPSQEEQEKAFEAALQFAGCMRDQGIDFPDPERAEGGGLTQAGPRGDFDPDGPRFREAEEACRHILEEVFGDDGPIRREVGP
ncbi:MAG: hypothetical protein ACRDHV_07840 [Actinomycetota bacterium]